MTQPQFDIRPGTMLAQRYRVDSLLGRGSMGAVYRGTQLSMKRSVAIKMLAAVGDDVNTWKKRFEREAVITSRLEHPNTVRVYDYGTTDDDHSFLVMELLKGRPLHQVVREDGPLAPERAIDLCIQVLSSLEEAHQAGIVHRDLKPANIFVTPMRRGREHVKVLDFGVAKITRDPSVQRLTQTSALVGTPHFMAPEQGRAEELDGRADLYAVGCILFALLTGQPPFLGTQVIEIVLGHLDKPIPNLRALRPDLPDLLQPAIEALMAKDAADRPFDAHEAIELLESVLADLEALPDDERQPDEGHTVPMDVVSTIPPPPARRMSRRSRLKRPISGGIPLAESTSAPTRAVKAAKKVRSTRAKPRESEAPRTRALRPPSIRKPTSGKVAKAGVQRPRKRPDKTDAEPPMLPDDALEPASEPDATRLAGEDKRHRQSGRVRLPARPKRPTPSAKKTVGTRLDFEFQLRGHTGKSAPSARIWVDVNADGEMQYDEEITDLETKPGTWRGTRHLDVESAEGVGFLVKFEASSGARWRLRVWSSLPRRHLVFEQKDRLHEDNGRVIGWCKA